jgi:hypothetical protein
VQHHQTALLPHHAYLAPLRKENCRKHGWERILSDDASSFSARTAVAGGGKSGKTFSSRVSEEMDFYLHTKRRLFTRPRLKLQGNMIYTGLIMKITMKYKGISRRISYEEPRFNVGWTWPSAQITVNKLLTILDFSSGAILTPRFSSS